MELSYFISMLQYEVLKSFDFSKEFQNEIEEEVNSQIQLSIDCAEIEIPLIFNSSKKEVKLKDEENKDLQELKKVRHEMPFNSSISMLRKKNGLGKFKPIKKELILKRNKLANSKESKIEGDVINVKVANPELKKDDSFDPNLIGKIKISIKPTLK